jgi:hypothetical protein
MQLKSKLVSMLAALSVLGCALAAQAQNTQQWLTREASKVQADYGSGAINQSQAGKLQQQTQSILNQEQQDMVRNGGYLTPQQQGQISQEIRGLNGHLSRDLAKNGNGILNGQYYGQQYPNPYNGQYSGQYNGQYNGNSGYGYGYNSNYGQYGNAPAPGSPQWQNWQAWRQQQMLNQNGQVNTQTFPNQGQFQTPFFHHWHHND